ncbi:hypothetical protein BH11PLA2_BH11PLA2_38270 [soil metagenome]
MDSDDASTLLARLLSVAEELIGTARTASRNGKSLSGDNHYGRKFHEHEVRLSATETKLRPAISGLGLEPQEVSNFEANLTKVKQVGTPLQSRIQSQKALRLQIESVIKPHMESLSASPIPHTEQVLPLSVVKKTRTYFEKIVTQANGCYEHQWFDACSVMIRRFVETLIIELYEAKGLESGIKDTGGDYLMLSKLIEKALAEKAWNLSRETKKSLPAVKSLGDRSAHNRRYVATKTDVQDVIPGLRVLADDLLHLAGLK